MAPDKIYSVIILDDSTPGNTRGAWSCVEVEGALNTEYIRKEALLEWAETNRDKLAALSDNDAVRWGQQNAFQQMIDKLNKL